MDATLLYRERRVLAENRFAEMVVWQLSAPLKGSKHSFKYRLALVVNGVCVVRYDNESGKGDHRHLGVVESAYSFTTPQNLLADFWKDAENWR